MRLHGFEACKVNSMSQHAHRYSLMFTFMMAHQHEDSVTKHVQYLVVIVDRCCIRRNERKESSAHALHVLRLDVS